MKSITPAQYALGLNAPNRNALTSIAVKVYLANYQPMVRLSRILLPSICPGVDYWLLQLMRANRGIVVPAL